MSKVIYKRTFAESLSFIQIVSRFSDLSGKINWNITVDCIVSEINFTLTRIICTGRDSRQVKFVGVFIATTSLHPTPMIALHILKTGLFYVDMGS